MRGLFFLRRAIVTGSSGRELVKISPGSVNLVQMTRPWMGGSQCKPPPPVLPEETQEDSAKKKITRDEHLPHKNTLWLLFLKP